MVKSEFVGPAITHQQFQALEEVAVLRCVVIREALIDQFYKEVDIIERNSEPMSQLPSVLKCVIIFQCLFPCFNTFL